MTDKTGFRPGWRKTPPEKNTFREIFKWGNPRGFKHPSDRLYAFLKQKFALTDADFMEKRNEGNEKVHLDIPRSLTDQQMDTLKNIAGKDHVATDAVSRVRYGHGKTMEETLRLRKGLVTHAADAVVHPRDRETIARIVRFADREGIPVYPYGGGSSVTLGLTPKKGGITLVMQTHMNRVLDFNETNQTITVEPGMMGPELERILNNAPKTLDARQAYTCGHFPQSFEYSSVGGWIVTLGSGQASSYYGDAYDLALAQEFVTPKGGIRTLPYPATATGPRINDIMKGSEGAFGILVSVTWKIFRYMPENRKRFAYIFPGWKNAVAAAREISQGEFGMPAVFRISDEEETEVGLKLYGVEDTVIDKMISLRGFKPGSRALCIGYTEGEKHFSENVKKQIGKIAKKHGGFYLTGYPVSKWEHGRYMDPYLREDLGDFGIIIDTLETGVTWDRLHNVHHEVRSYVKNRPKTVCMTHASHFYPQGTNLYFIFIAKMDNVDEYLEFQRGIIDTIQKSGGSLSHHHGVGRMIAPWMEEHLGVNEMEVLRALKQHFDPNNIMNPGGTLGLVKEETE